MSLTRSDAYHYTQNSLAKKITFGEVDRFVNTQKWNKYLIKEVNGNFYHLKEDLTTGKYLQFIGIVSQKNPFWSYTFDNSDHQIEEFSYKDYDDYAKAMKHLDGNPNREVIIAVRKNANGETYLDKNKKYFE